MKEVCPSLLLSKQVLQACCECIHVYVQVFVSGKVNELGIGRRELNVGWHIEVVSFELHCSS